MYVLLYSFDPKMKLVVGNMLVLLFASEKIKTLFRKPAEFVRWFFVGLGLLGVFWHHALCAVFCFFIRKYMEKSCFIVR